MGHILTNRLKWRRWFQIGVVALCLQITGLHATEPDDQAATKEPGQRVSVDVNIGGATIFDGVVYDSAVHAAEVPARGDAADGAQTALEISEQITRYEENLAYLESEGGPYDASLIEALMDMAHYYTKIGQHGVAATLYERVLNITRISSGLLSPEQLPVLDDLTAAHKAAGAWEKADDREHLEYYLKTRFYPPGSQAYADAVLSFGNWKMEAMRGNLLNRSALANMRDIEELHDIYVSALRKQDSDTLALPEGEQPVSAATHLSLLYAKAVSEHQLADYALHTVPPYLNRYVQRYVSEYVCTAAVGADGQPVQRCGTIRRENPQYRKIEMQRAAYRNRIQFAVIALKTSIDEIRTLVDADPTLVAEDGIPAQIRVDELTEMYKVVDRGYRRGTMMW